MWTRSLVAACLTAGVVLASAVAGCEPRQAGRGDPTQHERGSGAAQASRRGPQVEARGPGAASPASSSEARPPVAQLDAANPVRPLPARLLGLSGSLADLPDRPDPERARLGRWLFFDTRLSADGTVSCASCHEPRAAFGAVTAVSTGIRGQKGTRKAPVCTNLAFLPAPSFFWDGRASSLEEQAGFPIANPVEMGSTHDAATRAIASIRGYAPFFEQAFGDSRVSFERITRAIADYERTRLSANSPYDRWKSGREDAAVDEAVQRGDSLFFGKAACGRCHLGDLFTDARFHNLGVGFDPASGRFRDRGRAAVTGREEDLGAFKTPTLRDVALHPPFMHDGSMKDLETVMDHYVKGGTPNPHLSERMEPLQLTSAERADLIAMMRALTGEGHADTAPALFPR